jgi:prefoldin subunit 5
MADRSYYTDKELQKRIEAMNQMLRETLNRMEQNTALMEQIADCLERKREEP